MANFDPIISRRAFLAGGSAALASPMTAGIYCGADPPGDGDGHTNACTFRDGTQTTADRDEAAGEKSARDGVGIEVRIAAKDFNVRCGGGSIGSGRGLRGETAG